MIQVRWLSTQKSVTPADVRREMAVNQKNPFSKYAREHAGECFQRLAAAGTYTRLQYKVLFGAWKDVPVIIQVEK